MGGGGSGSEVGGIVMERQVMRGGSVAWTPLYPPVPLPMHAGPASTGGGSTRTAYSGTEGRRRRKEAVSQLRSAVPTAWSYCLVDVLLDTGALDPPIGSAAAAAVGAAGAAGTAAGATAGAAEVAAGAAEQSWVAGG